MRRVIPIVLVIGVLAFYGGVAGAAATPFYGAITDFMHNATARTPLAASTPTATPASQAAPSATPGSAGPAPTATAAPAPRATRTRQQGQQPIHATATVHAGKPATAPAGKPTPSASQIKGMVQHLSAAGKIPQGRTNILILGSDNDPKFKGYAHPPTQVMIVASIDPVSHTITLLSIPRDFWVHIPGYQYNYGPDGTLGWSKIDTAAELGFESSACTVESNFGIRIDNYIWVGLNGFTKVINSINGVTLDIPHPVIDDEYPDDTNPDNPYGYRRIYIPPGPQHLSGATALQFVRSRHGDTKGDFGRSDRQQILLTQLKHDLLSGGSANLVNMVPSLLTDFRDEIKTDMNTSLSTALTYYGLLQQMRHAKLNQVVLSPPYSSSFWVMDSTPEIEREAGTYPNPFQESAVAPNWTLINPEIQKLFGGQEAPIYNHYCAMVPGASR